MTSEDACCVTDSSKDGKWKDVSCNSLRVTQFMCKQSGEYFYRHRKNNENISIECYFQFYLFETNDLIWELWYFFKRTEQV